MPSASVNWNFFIAFSGNRRLHSISVGCLDRFLGTGRKLDDLADPSRRQRDGRGGFVCGFGLLGRERAEPLLPSELADGATPRLYRRPSSLVHLCVVPEGFPFEDRLPDFLPHLAPRRLHHVFRLVVLLHEQLGVCCPGTAGRDVRPRHDLLEPSSVRSQLSAPIAP